MLAAATAVVTPPQVLTRLNDPDVVAAGLTVELILPPRGISAHAYSARLIAASGIVARSPGDPIDNGTRTRFGAGAASVWGSDGRSAVVYYPPETNIDWRKIKVCRITASRAVPFMTRWHAIRWCHARLGYVTPETPPPIDN